MPGKHAQHHIAGGTDVIPDATNTSSGLLSSDEKNKLAGIEAGAEVNNISDADANELTGGGETDLHKHAADKITYTGNVPEATSVQEGLDRLHTRVEEIITTPPEGVSAQEIIDARKGKPTLRAKMDDLDSQLAENATEVEHLRVDTQQDIFNLQTTKMDKNTSDISVFQIDKNKGKFDQTYMTDEFLQQMAGTTPINAVPADKSITTNKLAFFPLKATGIGKNLFDKSAITSGYRVSSSNGLLYESATQSVTDYIQVEVGETYTMTGTTYALAFYDADKVFVSGILNVTAPFVVPENVVYLRITIPNENLNIAQLEKGPVATDYEPFRYIVDNVDFIRDRAIGREKLAEDYLSGVEGKNLFDKATITKGHYASYSHGGILANAAYDASDFIPILPGTDYALSGTNRQLAFYDENKVYISGILSPSATFASPSNAYFIRLTMDSGKANIVQLEQGILPTKYESYGVKLQETAIGEKVANAVKGYIHETSATVLTIKKDGSGDFTNIPDALNSVTDNSAGKPYVLKIHPGTYTEANWYMKDYVSIEGVDRDSCIIYTELPETATDEEIADNQCFWFTTTGYIKNLTVQCKNSRYPIHADAFGDNTDRELEIYNCHIEHLGNQEVIDYRIANGLSYNGVWKPTAWGCGTSSGWIIKAYASTFKGGANGFYFHNNANFSKPNYIELNNCRLLDEDDNRSAIAVSAIGSKTNDILVINNCECVGFLTYGDSSWFSDSIDYQPSNNAEVKIFGAGNTSMAFNLENRTRALRITSNTEDNSKVRLSGDATVVLFGTPVYEDGCPNIQGFVYGSENVAEMAVGLSSNKYITALGKRLGNCTTTNKTLTVTVDNLTPVNIVFNQDYTNVSNDSILSIINSALSGKGVADLMNVVEEKFYPYFQDEEVNLKNTSTLGIKRGMAVTYNTSNRNIRLMTSEDAGDDFVGVALENIKPNEIGRIKTKGKLRKSQIVISPAVTPYFKNKFGIGATEGVFTKDAPIALLKGVDINVVEF